jgi:2-methylisocitrate lyase-like PEP mutase family enzyme
MPTPARTEFRSLHVDGCFVMPNPWDLGSAKLLQSLGFHALATTSAGHAASLGKHDRHVTRDELVEHVTALTAAVSLPFNVDSERLFADSIAGVVETVDLLAGAGAAGCSIEDYNPHTDAIDVVWLATERVGAAAEACRRHGIVLTARAEAHLHGSTDLDETIARLQAFRDAGAEVVYAPGLTDLSQIAALVKALGIAVNVLAMPNGPSVPELASVGVRRVSTGGALAWAAYGAMVRGATELLQTGTSGYTRDNLPRANRAAFDFD